MGGKENLCLVRTLEETLVLETLYFAEDIRSRSEISETVASVDVKDAELEMARQLVESLAGPFDAEEYVNDHRVALRAMLDAKVKGEEIVAPEPAAAAPVIDIMDALKQSLADAKSASREDAPSKPRKRKSPARTPATKGRR